MGETEISWTHRPGTVGRSWNPGQGCSRVSEGCRHCYAERLAARFAESGWSQGLINLKTRKWNGTVRLAPHKLTEPLRWRQPSTVFANSMTDLFHEGYSNEQIAAVFGVMAAAPQHTFQILTKRAKRMGEWFKWMINALPLKDQDWDPRASACWDFAKKFIPGAIESSVWNSEFMDRAHTIPWPLPNVWLGVSVENQEAADERIPELLKTPAAVRFLSCEPLLSDLYLTPYLAGIATRGTIAADGSLSERPHPPLDWVIAGCESGPRSRPCSVEWLRSLRDQCDTAGVAYFLKQAVQHMVDGRDVVRDGTGSKCKAGLIIELPYLDGVQHAQFPEASNG